VLDDESLSTKFVSPVTPHLEHSTETSLNDSKRLEKVEEPKAHSNDTVRLLARLDTYKSDTDVPAY